MKTKVYFSPARYLLFIIIILLSLMLSALVDKNNGISESMASTTTLEPKHFSTVEKPMLGFKISYPSDWNITDNDFVTSFKAPSNAALVIFSITNLTSYTKENLTLEQYSSNEINTIKSVESKKVGNFFKLIESKPYLLSGQPGHEIAFLNGTSADIIHNYKKTLLVWTIVDGKVYQIRYSAEVSEYSNYIPTVFYMIDSFRLL
jgi:PsbP-like protein